MSTGPRWTIGVVAALVLTLGGLVWATGLASGGLTGSAPFNGSLTGNLSTTGDAGVGNNLAVAGDAGVAGNVSVGGTLSNQTWLGVATNAAGQIAHILGNTTTMNLAEDRYLLSVTRDNGSTEMLNVTAGASINMYGNITHTNSSGTFQLTSDTNDGQTSGTVGAITLKASGNITDSDLLLDVQNSASGHALTVTEQGAVAATSVTTTSTTQAANFTATTNAGINSNFASGYLAIRTAASNPLAIISLQNAGGSEFAQVTMNTAGTVGGFYIQPAQTVTVADDATGAAPATNITPTSNLVLMAYNDATAGSVGTLSETGAVADTTGAIVHTGSGNTVVFTDSSGVQEVGGTACTLATNGVMTWVYANSTFIITNCRQN